jgi:hypothetical protein
MKKLVSILVGLVLTVSVFSAPTINNNLTPEYDVISSEYAEYDIVMTQELHGVKIKLDAVGSSGVQIYYYEGNKILDSTVYLNNVFTDLNISNIFRIKVFSEFGIVTLDLNDNNDFVPPTKTAELKSSEEVNIYVYDNWIYYPANGYLDGVYNSTGQKVSVSEDVSDLPTGIYIVKVSIDGDTIKRKIIR